MSEVHLYRIGSATCRRDAPSMLVLLARGWTIASDPSPYDSVWLSIPEENANAGTNLPDLDIPRVAPRHRHARRRLLLRSPRALGWRGVLAMVSAMAFCAALLCAAAATVGIARGIERELAETVDHSPVGVQAVTVRAVPVERHRRRRR
jgi:hypothetical protein